MRASKPLYQAVGKESGFDNFGGKKWSQLGYSSLTLKPDQQSEAYKRAFEAYLNIRHILTYAFGPYNNEKDTSKNFASKFAKKQQVLKRNCLALSYSDKEKKPVACLNFLPPNASNKEALKNELSKVSRLLLEEGYYDRYERLHSEIRHAQKQAASGKSYAITVDKLCCLFCAIQLLAIGREKEVISNLGWHTRKLGWYTFSPAILYYSSFRRKIWGNSVEAYFSPLKDEDKLSFLQILSSIANGGDLAYKHYMKKTSFMQQILKKPEFQFNGTNYKIGEAKPDGNCLYDTVIQLLKFKIISVGKLREMVAKRHKADGTASAQHIQGVLGTAWGTVREDLRAISRIFSVRFIVIAFGTSGEHLQVDHVGTTGAQHMIVHTSDHFQPAFKS
jgi:hypothetical protein